MKFEKLVIWKDPKRDETEKVENKSKNLIEYLAQYGVEIINSYSMMPMVLVNVPKDQMEAIEKDEEIIVEENGEVHALPVSKYNKGKVLNCS